VRPGDVPIRTLPPSPRCSSLGVGKAESIPLKSCHTRSPSVLPRQVVEGYGRGVRGDRETPSTAPAAFGLSEYLCPENLMGFRDNATTIAKS
jgi:hypothetical protein